VTRARDGRFTKGSRRPPKAGRRPGTPNRATREWKDLVREIIADPDAQEALRRACIERPELMFKAAEHAYGKPRMSMDLNPDDRKMIR
jgi:hypothetical protein